MTKFKVHAFRFMTVAVMSCFPLACGNEKGPSPPKSPSDEQQTFQLDAGLHIELVASEPLIEDPVAMTFDAYGRLWVVEMRGYMTNVDREGADEPLGRVSVLIDTNHDGRMDSATVFLDSLVLPRTIAMVKGGVLIAENIPLWLATDTDGDLRADKKILIDSTYGGSGMPEHSPNGMWRGLDNWYYNASSNHRYRPIDGTWVKDDTEMRGQWGLSHDDAGRLYYNYNWSQLHADLVPPNYLSRNPNHTPTTGIDEGLTLDRRVFPIRPTPAVNRGYIPGTLDEDQRLLEFTAACSPFVYRENALPESYYGNAFVCEPAGNLIKRNIIESNGFFLSAHGAYDSREFLASTDERFRPVFLSSGPDGALYVVDMYRGIIEDGPYMTEYLRRQTLDRKLDHPINLGRIWRIVADGWSRPPHTELAGLASSDLVKHLADSSGWCRDMVQRLLVERADTTVVRNLESMVRGGTPYFARLHSLWSLEGMGRLSVPLLFAALHDKHPQVQCVALRMMEPFARTNHDVQTQLGNFLTGTLAGAEPAFILQVALSAACLEKQTAMDLLSDIFDRDGNSPLIRDAILSSLKNNESDLLASLLQSSTWQTETPARSVFIEMLATAIFKKGDKRELKILLARLDSSSHEWRDRALLTGLAVQSGTRINRPIELDIQPHIFSNDALEADTKAQVTKLARAFTWPGKKVEPPALITDVQLDSVALKQFATGRQHYLTVCATCHGADGNGLNRFGPPLTQSEWVLGNEQRLTLIVLHGMEGPLNVQGRHYDIPDILPVMPSHSTMDDRAIASILTYIRNAWGNQATPVTGRTVGQLRVTSQGKVVPWTAAELDAYMNRKADQHTQSQ